MNFKKIAPLLLIASMGCAGEDDIDRTQPNRFPKSMFQDVWYMRSTVIEVPGTTGASFVGLGGAMDKIRWEVQEDFLVAYRAYEELPGSTTITDGKENPVAAFPISSHFDIKRQYNAATGEQTNVISENASDRPWHERDWIRIDWTESSVDAQQFQGTFKSQPYNAAYFIQQHEGGENALRIVGADGGAVNFDDLDTDAQTEVEYFDMVGQFLLEPDTISFAYPGGSQSFPVCWLNGFSTQTCGPTAVKVRTAFMKARPRNYEPLAYSNQDMSKFGFFRTERHTLDRRYGLTESGRIYLANRHALWEKDYFEDDKGGLLVENGAYVPIPVAARTPKGITYHLSPEFPCDMVSTAKKVADGWNVSFRRAAAASKGLLRQTTGDREADVASLDRGIVPDMFTLDLNSWKQKVQNNDFSCANLEPQKTTAFLGDLRYSFMAWVQDRQVQGPLGFGPSSADPETGEIIAGMAYVYGEAIDRYAGSSLDIVRVLNGNLSVDAVVDSDYIRDYVLEHREATIPAQMHDAEFRLPDAMTERLNAIKEVGLQEARGSLQPRYSRLRGTPLADALIDDESRRGLASRLPGHDVLAADTEDLPAEVRDSLSPLFWGDDVISEIERRRRDYAAHNNIWLAEFSDDAIQGLAIELWKKYSGDTDAIYQELRELIFAGVMEHEVGHTLGLRHNFSGSYDSINFHDEYWELREETIVTPGPQGLNIGDLYTQANRTERQLSERMVEYQYSSIMDYGSKFNSDVQGLGKYDDAAIMFGYGGHVETFQQPTSGVRRLMTARFTDCTARYESRPNIAYSPLLEDFHYTTIYSVAGGRDGLQNRDLRPWAQIKAEQGAAFDACSNGGSESSTRHIEVPYMFCTDDYVGATVSCHRWDQGADPYEIVKNVTDSYRDYYFFNNYKRDRFGFDAFSVYSRISGRYFSYLPNVYQHWLFSVAFGRVQDDVMSNYWTIGMFNGFNLLMDTISTPGYGTYELAASGNFERSTEAVTEGAANTIERGEGRRRFSSFEFDSGHGFERRTREVGHFWEYRAALAALTNPFGTFVGVEQSADFTTYSVPYYLVFGDQLTQYFESITADDYSAYAPRFVDGVLQKRPAAFLELTGPQGPVFMNPGTGEIVPERPVGEPVDLNNWFTQRLLTLIMGMAEFSSNFDIEFSQRQQIFAGVEIEEAPEANMVECTDPRTGYRYAAVDGTGAARAVSTCAQAAAAFSSDPSNNAAAAVDEAVNWIETVRATYDVLGGVPL